MTSRSAQLRRQQRRVLGWSLAAAVLLHVAVFVFSPTFHADPLVGGDAHADLGDRPGTEARAPLAVDVRFGPPRITLPDGSTWTEPPDRVLEADRVVDLPPGCSQGMGGEGATATGAVRLRVPPSGRAEVVEVVEGAGNPCADRILSMVAGALWYHWLPDERFPAPVDLVQPLTLVETR
jgi:hypothetical protein